MPPLKPWQIMPVPPPTPPSGTGPSLAEASASSTCSARTCWPLTSLSIPSQVSPTTGSPQKSSCGPRARASNAISASRTTPTLCVLVIATGEVSVPDSRTHSSPVSSPLPFRRWLPANKGSAQICPRWGRITVTPVRTGPSPGRSGPPPRMMVAWPTRTPGTSVIALCRPGCP